MAVEPMEGRVLLSALAAGPDVPPGTRVGRPRGHAPDGRRRAIVDQTAGPSDTSAHVRDAAVVKGGQYAVSDAWNGYWLVHSKNVAKVGLNFAKLTVCAQHAEGRRRVHQGDPQGGQRPGSSSSSHTNAAKKVGQDFSSCRLRLA